jgi:hypothetical protein
LPRTRASSASRAPRERSEMTAAPVAPR